MKIRQKRKTVLAHRQIEVKKQAMYVLWRRFFFLVKCFTVLLFVWNSGTCSSCVLKYLDVICIILHQTQMFLFFFVINIGYWVSVRFDRRIYDCQDYKKSVGPLCHNQS